jgi:hypothetical protein
MTNFKAAMKSIRERLSESWDHLNTAVKIPRVNVRRDASVYVLEYRGLHSYRPTSNLEAKHHSAKVYYVEIR